MKTTTLTTWRLMAAKILAALFCIAGTSLPMEDARASEGDTNQAWLTLDRIFDSNEFDGESGESVRWAREGHAYYTWKSPKDGGGRSLMRKDPETDQETVLVPDHLLIPRGQSSPLSVDSYAFSDDESKLLIFTNSKRVWRRHTRGDYWVLDITARTLTKLGGDAAPSTLMFAEFSPDGTRVCYVRANNLYVQDLRSLEVTALTQDGSDSMINGTFDWVYEEEFRLYQGFRWSPDSAWIAYWQVNTEGVPRFHMIDYTAGLYPEILSFPYPKVGERNAAVRVGVVPSRGGETVWMQVPGDEREHYLARMEWLRDSESLLLQQFNRHQNTNRVYVARAATGDARQWLEETDAAWVEDVNEPRRLGDKDAFLWLSERSGWQQLYRVELDSGKPARLTKGEFDVLEISGVDESNGWIYFMASPDDAVRRYLYRTPIEGGKSQRVTPEDQPGTHRYDVAKDGLWAVHTYSTMDQPPRSELIRLPSHDTIRVLRENKELVEKLDRLRRPSSEFFTVDIGEGVGLDAWCIQPPDFDSGKVYPVLFLVYGEPAGLTVTDSWHGRSTLWYWMLAQKGYFVMSVDNRGTPGPKGRAWRKSVYRQVGVLASADQAAAVRAICAARPYVDPKRVAIWGWSGGGSMTLNAMFRNPEIYHTGMSVAPVPNQRLYDTIYQERYMALPSDNAEGYRLGSPITFAHQLQGNLLLVHGTGDDNCHYQGMESLIDELITHKKKFTMMAYPNRSHGISEGRNTTQHLYRLLTDYLMEKMPPGTW